MKLLADWVDGSNTVNKKETLESYLVNPQNWKTDATNKDIHYIMIPINSVEDGFGEAKYNIGINYTDLSGNTQEDPRLGL